MPFSVLTHIVTTTRQDGSVSTSEAEVTLFPSAASQASSNFASLASSDSAAQASSNSAHPVPVGAVIGIVGGIVAVLIFLSLLFLYHRQRKAIDHRFAVMGHGSNNVPQSK